MKTRMISIMIPTAAIFLATMDRVYAPVQPQKIIFTSIVVSNGVATINFTGSALGDPASDYILLGANQLNGAFTPVTGASITSLGSTNFNQYQAVVPINGPSQFYRIQWQF
jgi:hypothetical protein